MKMGNENKNENSALSLLTGAYFFLIMIPINIFMSDVVGLNMMNFFITVLAGFAVPLGIAHLVAIATHKLLKIIKPSFYFGETILFADKSRKEELVEKFYKYTLWSLIIIDVVIWVRLMQTM
tara:strand:- start:202 stop:567 length:366 start_codon:yes stop_codon:yes gene_type:complete